MDLKRRLIISNTITVLIPFAITAIIAFSFLFVFSKIFNKDIAYNSFKELAIINAELASARKDISKQNLQMDIEELQKYLEQKLAVLNGDFIIIKNDVSIYSSKDISRIDIEKCIEAAKSGPVNNKVKINNSLHIIESSQLKLGDGSSGNILLLAPIGDGFDVFQKFIILIVIIFIISFIIVNLFMSYQFSKRILQPVAILKTAASEISSGNLQCEISEDGDEEIQELCRDFEMMRVQLKDSVRMKMKYDDNRTALVSSISHDLKTPLTSIKGYVQGILDGVANTPEKLESYLKTVYSKAEQMDLMIDDLLLYSKLDLNQLPFNFEKVDIIEYFKFCVWESEPELKKSKIEITLKNELKHFKYVMLDRERMRRVIMNIIENSRKYMDKAVGEINISLRETNSSIIIDMKDNGSGIPESDINKIFDRFYRADAARSGTKGSGLGLAIAKQIVEGHKGKIWAISHGNEGTSILISLAKIVQE